MKTVSIYRDDFKQPEDGDADFFADICMKLGLVSGYDEAKNIEEIEIIVEDAEIIN